MEVVDDRVAAQSLVVRLEIVSQFLQERRQIARLAAAEVARENRRRPLRVLGVTPHTAVEVLESAEHAERRDDVAERERERRQSDDGLEVDERAVERGSGDYVAEREARDRSGAEIEARADRRIGTVQLERAAGQPGSEHQREPGDLEPEPERDRRREHRGRPGRQRRVSHASRQLVGRATHRSPEQLLKAARDEREAVVVEDRQEEV